MGQIIKVKPGFWRQLAADDVDSLIQIADAIHPGLPEAREIFLERLKLFPQGCLALVDDESAALGGYAISHPIQHRRPPALDSQLGQIAVEADQYYIHDLAILPTLRGQKLAQGAVALLLTVAEQYASTCLVSVYGTAKFWSQFGFVAVDIDEELRSKIAVYGADAVYLERQSKP